MAEPTRVNPPPHPADGGTPAEWVFDDGAESESADHYEAREYDAWFRYVAEPVEVAERDRRLSAAHRAVADAIEANDRVAFETSTALRDGAFWSLPAIEQETAGVRVTEATHRADADDDADGWY